MYRLGYRLCSDGKVNVIQAQEACITGIVGFLLKIQFKLPISICVYGPNPWDIHWCRSSLYNFFITPIARYILRHSDSIIADGSLTLDRLRRAGIEEKRLTWKVNVPSNIDKFVNSEGTRLRKKLLKKDSKHLLLFVGSMILQKNIPFLLYAFKDIIYRLPKTRLIIVGKGRRKHKYIELARSLRLEDHILWIDTVPHKDISAFFKACDILLLCSRFEGFPRVFMEAAASGIPIVTTDVSGCSDCIINNKTGYIVPQKDKNGFVNRVIKLLNNPKKSAFMGNLGKNLIRELSDKSDLFNQKQVEVWKDIFGNQK